MPEPKIDPLDALRTPTIPIAPDQAFAANLRSRLQRAVSRPTSKEPPMTTNLTTRSRNGFRHGDVSYITLGLPDLARGLAFYGAVLGWRFSPGSSEHGAQVDAVVPMTGLWDGEPPSGGRARARCSASEWTTSLPPLTLSERTGAPSATLIASPMP